MITRSKLLLTFAAALLLAACPGNQREDVSHTAPKQTSTTVSNPQPENSTAMNPIVPPQKDVPGSRPSVAENGRVNVDLLEYEIRMPDTVSAGKQVFAIINHGKENHSFRIKGDGLDIGMTEPLARGDTGQITVALQPGTYAITCPVDGHAGKGMTRTLTVR
jgi:plastocyanin